VIMVLVGERIIHPLCMIDRPWLWVTPMIANDTDAGVIINGAHGNRLCTYDTYGSTTDDAIRHIVMGCLCDEGLHMLGDQW